MDDDGTTLVIGLRAKAPPDTPPPQSVQERIKAKQAPPKVQHRKRWEVWLDLLDRTTGKRAAPAAKLWDWAHFPDEAGIPNDEVANPGNMGPRPLPTPCALRPDAGLFALVDPSDVRRV